MDPWSRIATLFAAHARARSDSWELARFSHLSTAKEEVYLVKTANQTVESPSNQRSAAHAEEAQFEEFQESAVARATAVGSQPTQTTRRYDYHIIHSATFGVPVLYFNVCNADGSMLSSDEIWHSIPESYRTSVTDRSTFLTQADHPYLGVPFYYIHPCQTLKLLTEAGLNCDNAEDGLQALLCWLSLCGPIVGLNYSHEWYIISETKKP